MLAWEEAYNAARNRYSWNARHLDSIRASFDKLFNYSGRRNASGVCVSEPLYKLKAEFFKTLGHPARIRILELLAEHDRTVSELLPEVGLEASNLSQQLGVLRRAGVVAAQKDGNTVTYSIASPVIADLLTVARKVLTGMLSDQVAMLEDLRAVAPADRR